MIVLRLLIPLKALLGILVPPVIVMVVNVSGIPYILPAPSKELYVPFGTSRLNKFICNGYLLLSTSLLLKPAYGSVRLSSAVQSLNVLAPIDSTPFFITAVFNDVQPLNAYCPIVFTEPGTITLVIPLQFSNALFPINVTVFGIVNAPNFAELQPLNALFPILVNLLGNTPVSINVQS